METDAVGDVGNGRSWIYVQPEKVQILHTTGSCGRELGRELLYYGYRLSSKFLASWVGLQIPRKLAQLQNLLGKLLYCSAHIPNYKQLVAPLEQLLSPCAEAVWTMECTQSLNMLLKWVFKHVRMHQPSAGGFF